MKEYLAEGEQYKKILNQGEIARIKDPELRSIREKYWDLRHKAFLDEHRIPDHELGKVFDELIEKEEQEIEEYRKRLYSNA